MRLRYVSLVVVLALVLATFAMAGGRPEPAAEPVIQMRIASTGGTTSLRGDALRYFQEILEERTNGRIAVRLYLDAQLGGDEENTFQLQEGSVEAILNGTAPHFMFGEEMGIEYWPFVFDGPDHLIAFYGTSDYVAQVDQMLINDFGIRPLVLATRGPRHITSNRPVRRPEDLRGMRFRAPGLDVVIKAFEALGANVVGMPLTELVGAMQAGLVDGQENPVDNIYSWGLYEVQDFISLTHHTYSGRMLYVNEAWWQNLTPELQNAVVEAAQDMADFIRARIEDTDAENLSKMEEMGVTLLEVDVEAFRSAFENSITVLPQSYQDLYWEIRALSY